MGKYINLEDDVFSVFASNAWKAEKIPTYPTNFLITGNLKEFIRVSIIPSGVGVNRISVSGLVIIDIFAAAGESSKRNFLIADTLDRHLVNRVFTTSDSGSTQFLGSTLSIVGFDKHNPSLFRASYSIPFNFFGVL